MQHIQQRFVFLFAFVLVALIGEAGEISTYAKALTAESAVDSFPYELYLSNINEIKGITLGRERKQLDSLKFNGRLIVYKLYTSYLRTFENKKQADFTPAYLQEKINLGQAFMNYADNEEHDPRLFSAIGTFWLEYVNQIIADTVATNPKLAYQREFNYTILRLRENKFAPSMPPESNSEKLITTVAEKEWGHLFERYMERTGAWMKLATLFSGLIFCVGLFSLLKFSTLRLKKIIA